ncbi:MAG: hypothetical protein Q7R71_00880 [bacterium]|nr:hypothetical protein [bacterium]
MNKFFEDSGFAAIVKTEVEKRNKIEMTVAQLGFPEGASIIEINQRVKELGYKEFPDNMLLYAAKHPGKIYSSGASFVLRKK